MESKPADDLGFLAASFPLLVYDHGEQPDNHQTTLTVADGSTRTCRVPELRDSRCLETERGLLLTVHAVTSHASLWNPETGEKTALPAMDKALPEHCRCLLSDTISSPECIVLVHNLAQPELTFCRVTGGGAWVSQAYYIGLYALPPQSESFPPTKKQITAMTAMEGKFYFTKSQDVLGVLSFAHDPEEPHMEMELASFGARMPIIDSSDAPQVVTVTYLLESSQELFLVCLFFLVLQRRPTGCHSLERIEEIGVYKMDFSRKEWCKVTDIGDRAFLLGAHRFAASCSAAEHGLKKGCVYFALDFFGDSNEYHIFDLLEGTRQLAGPPKHVPLPAREPFLCSRKALSV